MEGDSTSEGVSGALVTPKKTPTNPPSPPSGPRWTCRYERSEIGPELAGSDEPSSNTARHCTSSGREQEKGESGGEGASPAIFADQCRLQVCLLQPCIRVSSEAPRSNGIGSREKAQSGRRRL